MSTVIFMCPNCWKENRIPYGEPLKCKDCVHEFKMRENNG